ncbi:MAG TPA: alpha/beta hydrolase fold domain-containing protein [Verrucomicrobiales bacterium]|nr:alpha/beta hydrolase fold domain-containing protein [Verrucomicrobiales bacterium]
MKNHRVAIWAVAVSSLLWLAAPATAQLPRERLFARLDADKDGKLSKEELPPRQQSNFEEIDANGDGFISREEFDAYSGRARPAREPGRARVQRMQPAHADLSYGPHERNTIDLYLAESSTPTPLVLYIHGGGFRSGDKGSVGREDLRTFLGEGWSVAAINYRLTDVAPAPAQYLDCARALQFLRHNASRWNLNPKLVASTGGSAGAGTSMWLAFHDDLADPESEDRIARESTRLTCIAVSDGQSSYDPRFAEKIGIPRPNFERHGFFEPFYDIKLAGEDTPEAYRRYEEAAPITYLTKDDPPALLQYSYANEEVTPESSLGLVVHHPKFGIALKEEMDKLGIECVVQFRDLGEEGMIRHGGGELVQPVDFLRKHFQATAGKE